MSESTTTTVPAGGLSKRQRRGIDKKMACSLKPADLIEDDVDDSGEPRLLSFVTYIDDNTRNEVKIPCTKAVYRKVTGDPKPGRQSVRALSNRLNTHFLIAVENVENKLTATGIDILPEIEARKFGMVPEDQASIEQVALAINTVTGEMEVKAVPPHLTKRTLLHIMAAVDKEDHLYPGQRLGGRHEVTGVSGNLVYVEPGGA